MRNRAFLDATGRDVMGWVRRTHWWTRLTRAAASPLVVPCRVLPYLLGTPLGIEVNMGDD